MPRGLLLAFLALSTPVPGAGAPEDPLPFDAQKAAAAARLTDPAEATAAYLASVPAERRARTKAYARGNYVLNVVRTGWDLLVYAALLAFGFSARLRDRAVRLTRGGPLEVAAYFVPFLAITTLLRFPLVLYRSYYREKAYGLLTQGLPDWLIDRLKAFGLGALFGSLVLLALYAVLRRTPRTWWLWGSAVLVAFEIVGVAIGPVFIAPLFNTFRPVQDDAIRQSILAMARERGIPADDVYETDISRRSDRVTAYVAGALGTTRVVMGDTTLRRCTPDEIRMVMGHEMGHYVLNHVWKGIGVSAAVIVAGFLFVRWGFAFVCARWPALGIRDVGDVAGLPLFLLLLTLFVSAASPALNAYTRRSETEADAFGLDASRAPDAAATTFLKLGEYRDLDPHPLVEWLFYDHPSGRNRIRRAMDWKQARSAGVTGP